MTLFRKSCKEVLSIFALAISVLLLTTVTLSGNALACTLANWPDTAAATGQACDPTMSCPRLQDECSYQASATGVDYVGHGAGPDGAAGTATEFSNRFYLFLGNFTGGSVVVFRAVNGTTAVIELEINGATKAATLTSGANTIGPVTLSSTWVSIAIRRNASNQVSMLVDGVSAGSIAGSADPITDARVGSVASNSGAGDIFVDSYVANRTQDPAATLCEGDTATSTVPSDGTRNFGDMGNIFAEIQSAGSNLSQGVPDCNLDGIINFGDLGCIFALIQGAAGTCPTI
jgi:hypothetical protein